MVRPGPDQSRGVSPPNPPQCALQPGRHLTNQARRTTASALERVSIPLSLQTDSAEGLRRQVPPHPRPVHPHITPAPALSTPRETVGFIQGSLKAGTPHAASGWKMPPSPKVCTLEGGTPRALSPPSTSDISSLTCSPSGRRLETPHWVSGQPGRRPSRLLGTRMKGLSLPSLI